MPELGQNSVSPWFKRFIFLNAAATFLLIWMGGLVTSHNAGLAVPDWPNTYGYNMFFFPISRWVGNIYYEHTHRLMASIVGMLTTTVMVWSFVRPTPKWMRKLAVIAFFGVVAQGILGGLRVIELKDVLGVFHGILAQSFFVLVASIALLQTDFWRKLAWHGEVDKSGTRFLFVLTTCVVFCQLTLGATMRHQHAGLAIPDFPTAYGKLWPNTDHASVLHYNQMRTEVDGEQPITAAQVILQMIHRVVAATILILVATCLIHAWRRYGKQHPLTRATMIWMGLVFVQVFLGAATIWTGKSADVATAHVACGALCLVTGGLTSILSFRILRSPVALASTVNTNIAPAFAPSSLQS